MALESGRVGVRKDQVDTYGRVAIAEDMAEHWLATKMYRAGEFVLYKNDYYKALFDNVGSAPDLFQDWELTKIGNEVSSLYDEIASIKTNSAIESKTVSGLTLDYSIRNGVCYCYLHGIPTSQNIVFENIPKLLINVNEFSYFWRDTSKNLFIGGAGGTTTISALPSATNGPIHYSFSYLIA